MADEAPDEEEAPPLVTLWDFIEKYQRVISVAGVFVALALFWKIVLGQASAPYISYLCLLITVPLLLEANKGYEYEKSSWNLVAFMSLWYGILAYTAYYLLVGYPDHLYNIVLGLIFATLNYSLLFLTTRFFNAMKLNEYKRAVGFQKFLEEKESSIEKRNELMTQKNEDSRKYYRTIDRANTACSICVFVFALCVPALLGNYIRAILYIIFNITPQIDALPLP